MSVSHHVPHIDNALDCQTKQSIRQEHLIGLLRTCWKRHDYIHARKRYQRDSSLFPICFLVWGAPDRSLGKAYTIANVSCDLLALDGVCILVATPFASLNLYHYILNNIQRHKMVCFGLSARLKQKFSRRKKVGQGNSKEVTISSSTKETSHQSTAAPSYGPIVSEKNFLSGRPRPRTPEPTVTTDDHVMPPSPPTGQDPSQPNDAVTSTTQIHDDHDFTDEISSPEPHDGDVVEGSRTTERAKITDVEYYATGYCGLCRTQLPHNYLPVLEKRTEEWEQWERDCRAGMYMLEMKRPFRGV